MRGQKGITLVALVITIIILLILAVVTITAVKGDGIINYAKNAGTSYNDAADLENQTLTNLYHHLQNATENIK